jgi:CheY-like chemotaxis protein
MTRIRALIVEDNKIWQSILQRVLKSSSCHTILAAGYDEAIERLEEESFDLVTVDMALSELEQDPRVPSSGWLLVHYLREHSPETPVVVITGSPGFQEHPRRVADLFTKHNIVDFLWKGGTEEIQTKLHELVESLIKARTSVAPNDVARLGARRNPTETRKKFEDLIRDSAGIIHGWEQALQTGRPEEKLEAQRKIQEQWSNIEHYLTEYQRIVGDKLPPDIAQVAAHFAAPAPES